MKKLKIGIVGLGYMGNYHMRSYLANPRCSVFAVCDIDEKGAMHKMKELNCTAKYFSDYDMFLEQVDAVSICSPNHMHASQSIAAAKAGKHVLCEKPMATSLEDAQRILAAVEKAEIKFMVGYHRRFNPISQQSKKMVQRGDLGRIFFAECDYLDYIPLELPIWSSLKNQRFSGSLFHAGAGHCVDLLRWIVGEIIEVTAFKDIYVRDVATEDTAIALYRFKNGAIGKCQFSLCSIRPFKFSLSLYGKKGTIVNNKLCLDTFPDFHLLKQRAWVEFPENWIWSNVPCTINEPHHLEINHFVDCIIDDKEPLIGVRDGYKTTEVCLATVKAAEEKRIVKLSIP